jgi:hypothetical protein
MNADECQIYCLETIVEGKPEPVPQPLNRHLRLAIASRISPRLKRNLRRYWTRLRASTSNTRMEAKVPSVPATAAPAMALEAGDLVRVRTKEQIQATLDPWGKLKGCQFMPEMVPYCDTVQRVHKYMERFLDECTYTIRRCRGLVLLEGIMCEGVAESGRCDRSCFYFWREEWLEKIDGPEASVPTA